MTLSPQRKVVTARTHATFWEKNLSYFLTNNLEYQMSDSRCVFRMPNAERHCDEGGAKEELTEELETHSDDQAAA
jgi:hypothetical protein